MGRQGRAVIEYAAKMNALGINERSLAGDHNPIADHVAIIGQDKMRLLPGVPAAPARMVTALEGDGGRGLGRVEDCRASKSCFLRTVSCLQLAVVDTTGRLANYDQLTTPL